MTLAGIKKTDFITKEQIHNELISNRGVQTAIKNLLNSIDYSIDLAIGFSIGGFVLWKAVMNNLKVEKLYCFSSTRLRYETQKPHCYSKVVFGVNDPFVPTETWCKKLNVEYQFIKNQDHEFYRKEELLLPLFCE